MTKRTALFLILMLALPASARDVISGGAGGGINWTEGYVWADGFGVAPQGAPDAKKRLLARRAAQVDAYRNLAEFISGVRVSSETVVRDMALESDTVRTKIEAMVKGAVMTTDHYQNNVGQVRMRIDFDGDFSSLTSRELVERDGISARSDLAADAANMLAGLIQLLVPAAQAVENGSLVQSRADLDLANRLLRESRDREATDLLEQLRRDTATYRDNRPYTGLLVDASDVPNFELATIPRLRDPNGQIIYPTAELLSADLARQRPVSYDFAVEDAVRNARIAVNPLVVRATSVFKARHSDLVISAQDADFIRENADMLRVIRHAGVMIVVAE